MFGIQFYPTPKSLADKMVSKIKFSRKSMQVLEPSAGKGDLISAFIRGRKSFDGEYRIPVFDYIDFIEISPELSKILYATYNKPTVADDFLEYNTFTQYDLIIMNPPFQDGDKHLLKAIEMMSTSGGQIVCILNAETIKNPFSNIRKDLINKLNLYGAECEFLESEFSEAEVKTNVEIALIYIDIPRRYNDELLNNLQKSLLDEEDSNNYEFSSITKENTIDTLIRQFNLEIKFGLKLIDDYESLIRAVPQMKMETMSITSDTNAVDYALINMTINPYGLPYEARKTVNELCKKNIYVKALRYKYWSALFRTNQIQSLLTEEMNKTYFYHLIKMIDYDFNKRNILQLQADISSNMSKSMDDAIVRAFEKLTYEHSLGRENNIHYYNGWHTNKAYKINNKVILPCYGIYDGFLGWRYHQIQGTLSELEKIFTYLNGGNKSDKTVNDIFTQINVDKHRISGYVEPQNIEFEYFSLSLKKKGTMHIKFKDEKLLKRFNIFAGKMKGWLPGSYGEKTYETMDDEEKSVVDSFEGENLYNETVNNKSYYLGQTQLLALGE